MPLIYLYSHDGEGLGHFRRNLNIAEAACTAIPGTSALLLTGSLYPGLFHLPQHCDYVKIPALQKLGKHRYGSPLGESQVGLSVRTRKDLLKAVVKSAPPDVFIVDKHPGGLNGELLPALKWLRDHSPGTTIILGLRDVLDTPEQVQREWQKVGVGDILRRFYDRVWIYGDLQVYDTLSAYSFSPELRRIAIPVGYLTRPTRPRPVETAGGYSVVVMAGGGHDGFSMMQASLHAIGQLRSRYSKMTARLYTGPLMGDLEHRRLKELARQYAGTFQIERFSQRLHRNIANADAVISMGGYNSVLECVSTGKPTIIIPREHPRKEQLIRARAFEARGYLRVVCQSELLGNRLKDELDGILCSRWLPPSTSRLNFSGLDQVVAQIQHLPNPLVRLHASNAR